MTKTSFMSGKLCILSCRSFQREIAAAIAAEAWNDVTVAAFSCPLWPPTGELG